MKRFVILLGALFLLAGCEQEKVVDDKKSAPAATYTMVPSQRDAQAAPPAEK